MKTILLAAACAAVTLGCVMPAAAHDDEAKRNDMNHDHQIHADGHAPIGVMGDHMHKAGEFMVSYRYMNMQMQGNRIGTDGISPEEIVTTVPNPFAGPPTLRVVPTEMTMEMHMFGAMYAPSDWLTLMVMGSYGEKSMQHTTFMGMAGTTELGEFTTTSHGFGDTRLSGLLRIYEDEIHHVHLNLGLSAPTGDIRQGDNVLTPMNTTPVLRLPYAMQLGSGTWDLLPGITYSGHAGDFGWGAQYMATLRLGENAEDYALGDEHRMTLWGSYRWAPWISTSLRVSGQTVGRIDGMSADVTAPVQTADPDNYGGERVDLAVGVNLVGQEGLLRGHRLAFEIGAPVWQDLNGPQMETDLILTLGYQYSF